MIVINKKIANCIDDRYKLNPFLKEKFLYFLTRIIANCIDDRYKLSHYG
jgi:hypothetical protein